MMPVQTLGRKGAARAIAAFILFICLVWVGVAPAARAYDYTIRAGDVLKITVWGQDDLSKEYPVDDDGFVPFPLVGRVKASGLTTKAFASRLTEALEKDYLVNPQVLVSVKEYFFNPSPSPKPRPDSGG
jgi:protein involved in polysaccharide export with SLBB domain